MDKLIVSISEREENEIDRLLRKIENIRNNCEHDFRLLEKPEELKESEVEGVFIIYDAEYSLVATGVLRCLRCSLEKRILFSDEMLCPVCLEELELLGLYDRSGYFKHDCNYNSARLLQCTSCGSRFVKDEWDQ